MLYTLSGGKNGDYRVTTGIYTPSTIEYSEKVFGYSPHGLTEVTIADIPMAINLLTYFDGRLFVGPNNAAFYELKIKYAPATKQRKRHWGASLFFIS